MMLYLLGRCNPLASVGRRRELWRSRKGWCDRRRM